MQAVRSRKPEWLRARIGSGPGFRRMEALIRRHRLHTVCEEALCPNRGRCWEHGRATVMILGKRCTRSCGFCSVSSSRPVAPDPAEPQRVAEAVRGMGLREVVLTSVTRDDLADGGLGVWAETIRRVCEAVPGIAVEALIPDFGGSAQAVRRVVEAGAAVLGHNLETVPSRYARARPQAEYGRSLGILTAAAETGVITKTAMMVGLGETESDVIRVMKDARSAGCEIFCIGQYLQPTREHLPVERYVEPGGFETYARRGREIGFPVVVSAPLARSSYYSEEQAAYVRGRLASKSEAA